MKPSADSPGLNYREVRLLLTMMGVSVPKMAREIGENVNSVYDALKRDFQGPTYRRIRDKVEAYLARTRGQVQDQMNQRQTPRKTLVIMGAGGPGFYSSIDLQNAQATIGLTDPITPDHRGAAMREDGLDSGPRAGRETVREYGAANQITLRLSGPAHAGLGEIFEVELLTCPAPIDPRLCDGCGTCAQACPEQCIRKTERRTGAVDDAGQAGFSAGSPIKGQPYFAVDMRSCRRRGDDDCQVCRDACTHAAIDFNRPQVASSLKADAVLICAGHEGPFAAPGSFFSAITERKVPNSEKGVTG